MTDGTRAAAHDVVTKLAALFGPSATRPVALHEPNLGEHEVELVADCVRSGWVSSVGAYVDQFERKLEQLTGATHAVATVNGTAALHTCLNLVGVAAGDEVLLPALTFVATANAVVYQGAIPHFVDSDSKRLAIDADKLRKYLHDITEWRDGHLINRLTNRPISAMIVMHVFGHPADMDALDAVAREFRIPIVEDAAESLGSTYKGRHSGCLGTVSALSFNGNKTITTGGGGAILTQDATLGMRAKHLTTTARVASGWEFVHDEVGFNYRMPNLNAALGVAQLSRFDQLVQKKRQLATHYLSLFQNSPEVRMVQEPSDSTSNYWLNALLLPDKANRDTVLERTNAAGIMTRPCWTLMHELTHFSDCPRDDLSVASDIVARLVNLPSSPHLADNL
jgi:perosamine synthetase